MKKRVLVSGASGFIGAHVVQYLLEKTDWEIISLDRYDTAGNINRLAEVIPEDQKHRVKIIYHDLKAPINEFTTRAIATVDNIIHLAAGSHVDRSIEDPVSFVMDNVVGTTNLLVWAKNGGLSKEPGSKFINFSTDEVFGPAPGTYCHKEDDSHKPSNPYSASKSGQEAMGQAFFTTYKLPVITTHTMNCFGERQHPEKLIPATIRAVMEGREMPIFAELTKLDGNLIAVGSRYWIHCRNTASAILFLLEKGTPGEKYNIIGFDELTNFEIAQKIAKIIGKPLKYKLVDVDKVRPGHDKRYALDGTKMKDMGWRPEVDFDESLRQTVEFTLANKQWS